MECYATPWPLWRDSRILWHIVETSYAFEVSCSLSLPPSFASLSDWRRVFACLQARGTRVCNKGIYLWLFNIRGNCSLQFPPVLNFLMCVLLFVLLEWECGIITLLKLDFSLFFGFKHVFSHCQKLWTSFDMREKQALRSTNTFAVLKTCLDCSW